MKKAFFFLCSVLLAAIFCFRAFPHCQIPCGIYDDGMRIRMIREDITTIEKSMNEIRRLSGEEDKNFNQIVRWIDNKDHHADRLSEIVTYYFMAQRLKPLDRTDRMYEENLEKLVLLHELLYYSMKAKQTTDLSYIGKMRDVTQRLEKLVLER